MQATSDREFISFIIEEMPEIVNDMTINFIERLIADEFFQKKWLRYIDR